MPHQMLKILEAYGKGGKGIPDDIPEVLCSYSEFFLLLSILYTQNLCTQLSSSMFNMFYCMMVSAFPWPEMSLVWPEVSLL